MKARMMTPPTVPPTMRISFVFPFEDVEEVEDSAVAEEVLDAVEPAVVALLASGVAVVVGLGSKEGVVREWVSEEALVWACCVGVVWC